MKKLLLFTCCIFALMPLKDAQSLVVSDPGAYSRMAQELAQLKKHFDVLKEQFAELQSIHKSVTGNLKRGKGIFRDLGKLQDLAEKMTKGLHTLPHMDLEDYDLKNIEDLQEAIDKVYGDEQGILQRGQTAQQREEYKQRSVRSALESSETLLALQEERFQKITELADQIDSTETLKDAMDLNNRLLGEILLLQQQSLLLQAQYVRANQALNYQYADVTGSTADPNKNQDRTGVEGAGKRFSKKMEEKRKAAGWEEPPF